MTIINLYAFVEDIPSAAVAKKMVAYVNRMSKDKIAFRQGFPSVERGFGNIKTKIPALIKMAKNGSPSLVITDLDRASCAPGLIQEWAKTSLALPEGFIFRVAVREIESWLLADREGFSSFMDIPKANFMQSPDTLPDPKQFLLNVIQKKGRKKWHREMLPIGPTSAIGPRYNEKLCTFINECWNPDRAKANSPSLASALMALVKLCGQ